MDFRFDLHLGQLLLQDDRVVRVRGCRHHRSLLVSELWRVLGKHLLHLLQLLLLMLLHLRIQSIGA